MTIAERKAQANMEKQWFAIRTAPGAQRLAKARVGEKDHRKGETLIERSLRDEGFEIYLPSMRKDIRHHRTKKITTRRFPLLVGYAFVDAGPVPNFLRLSACDGVYRVLGISGTPWRIPTAVIDRFKAAEGNMDFDDTIEAKIKRNERARRKVDDMRLRFPAGTPIIVTDGIFAGFSGHVVSVSGRECVKAMIDIFGRLSPAEFPVDMVGMVA